MTDDEVKDELHRQLDQFCDEEITRITVSLSYIEQSTGDPKYQMGLTTDVMNMTQGMQKLIVMMGMSEQSLRADEAVRRIDAGEWEQIEEIGIQTMVTIEGNTDA